MTYDQALWRAALRARRARDWRYVVLDCGEYAVASDFDLDTFFDGAPVVATFGPDGMRETDGD